MISEERLAELRELFPVGQPITLTKNRNLILELINVRETLVDYWQNFNEKLVEVATKQLISANEIDEEDSIEVDGGDLDDYMDDLPALKEIGINFDFLDKDKCPVPLISLMSRYDTAEDAVAFFDVLIDWLIQIDLDINSEEFDLINIDLSSKGVPIVIGYNPGMF